MIDVMNGSSAKLYRASQFVAPGFCTLMKQSHYAIKILFFIIFSFLLASCSNAPPDVNEAGEVETGTTVTKKIPVFANAILAAQLKAGYVGSLPSNYNCSTSPSTDNSGLPACLTNLPTTQWQNSGVSAATNTAVTIEINGTVFLSNIQGTVNVTSTNSNSPNFATFGTNPNYVMLDPSDLVTLTIEPGAYANKIYKSGTTATTACSSYTAGMFNASDSTCYLDKGIGLGVGAYGWLSSFRGAEWSASLPVINNPVCSALSLNCGPASFLTYYHWFTQHDGGGSPDPLIMGNTVPVMFDNERLGGANLNKYMNCLATDSDPSCTISSTTPPDDALRMTLQDLSPVQPAAIAVKNSLGISFPTQNTTVTAEQSQSYLRFFFYPQKAGQLGFYIFEPGASGGYQVGFNVQSAKYSASYSNITTGNTPAFTSNCPGANAGLCPADQPSINGAPARVNLQANNPNNGKVEYCISSTDPAVDPTACGNINGLAGVQGVIQAGSAPNSGVQEGLVPSFTPTGAGNIYFRVIDDGNYGVVQPVTAGDPYGDNFGNYLATITVVKETKAPTWFTDHIALPVITKLRLMMSSNSQVIYNTIVNNADFIATAKGMLVLFVSIYGIMFIAGMTEISSTELIKVLFKIGIVVQLMQPGSFQWFNDNLFKMFTDGTNELALMVVGEDNPNLPNGGKCITAADLSGYTNTDGSKLTLYEATQLANASSLFCFVDDILDAFFSKSSLVRCLALLITPPGWLVLWLVFEALKKYLVVIFQGFMGYLVMIALVFFLISVFPIFLTLSVFNYTRRYFWGWLNYTINYTMQPVIYFAFLKLINAMIMVFLYQLMHFDMKWQCVLPLKINLSGILEVFGVGSSTSQMFSFSLFCINWMTPSSLFDVFIDGVIVLMLISSLKGMLDFVPTLSESLMSGGFGSSGPDSNGVAPGAGTPMTSGGTSGLGNQTSIAESMMGGISRASGTSSKYDYGIDPNTGKKGRYIEPGQLKHEALQKKLKGEVADQLAGTHDNNVTKPSTFRASGSVNPNSLLNKSVTKEGVAASSNKFAQAQQAGAGTGASGGVSQASRTGTGNQAQQAGASGGAGGGVSQASRARAGNMPVAAQSISANRALDPATSRAPVGAAGAGVGARVGAGAGVGARVGTGVGVGVGAGVRAGTGVGTGVGAGVRAGTGAPVAGAGVGVGTGLGAGAGRMPAVPPVLADTGIRGIPPVAVAGVRGTPPVPPVAPVGQRVRADREGDVPRPTGALQDADMMARRGAARPEPTIAPPALPMTPQRELEERARDVAAALPQRMVELGVAARGVIIPTDLTPDMVAEYADLSKEKVNSIPVAREHMHGLVNSNEDGDNLDGIHGQIREFACTTNDPVFIQDVERRVEELSRTADARAAAAALRQPGVANEQDDLSARKDTIERYRLMSLIADRMGREG